MIISINQILLQLILRQFGLTVYKKKRFLRVGTKTEIARLKFFSKVFGKQNIDLSQAFHKHQLFFIRILKIISFNR